LYNRHRVNAGFLKITILLTVLFSALILVSCFEAEDVIYDAGGEINIPVHTASEPVTPELPANETDPSFTINDPRVEMIEVRQSPKPVDDHFAAGRETMVVVTFHKPVGEIFRNGIPLCYVSVYKDEKFITLLETPGDSGGHTLFFQPKKLTDSDNWEEGSYTFILYLEEDEGDPAAILKADFKKSNAVEYKKDPPELPEGFADSEDAPPFILNEQDVIQEIILGQDIRVEAEVYDVRDGWLTGEEIVWTLEGKEYMSGSVLWVWPYELPPGTYTFTCTATNSEGLSSQKDFTFLITKSDILLPDDWSRKELDKALAKGLILPLDRLDVPVSRGAYAALMTGFYNTFSQTGASFPGDGFGSMQSLTEEEAAGIMCRTILKAIPDFMGSGGDETLVMEALYSLGVYNEYGPDAFQPPEKLSNRLALIRINRLYDAVFSDELRLIADGFELYKCDIAAGAMRNVMIKEGKQGAVVNLYFYDGSTVHAEGYGVDKHIISRTGIHVGVLYNGRIHCNVFPAGLPEKEWLSCFHVDSGKRPRIEYLPV